MAAVALPPLAPLVPFILTIDVSSRLWLEKYIGYINQKEEKRVRAEKRKQDSSIRSRLNLGI